MQAFASEPLPEVETPSARNWIRVLGAYKTPRIQRSVLELALTFLPLFALWGAAIWLMSVNIWLSLAPSVLAGLFLVRVFLIQHDCAHGAFFKNRMTNDWVGRVLGVFTLTPHDPWQRSHLVHHSGHGNLERRGVGDVLTLTVEEYHARDFIGRFRYRLYRHPIVLFGLGPAFLFLIHHRLPFGSMKSGKRYWINTLASNLAVLAFASAGVWAFGWAEFLVPFFVAVITGATAGVWLFYVQHQFEQTSWDEEGDWQLHEAALYGSSHYDLPQPLRWITANIGIHHVHHLYSRIPFYNLPKVLKAHPELRDTGRITLLDSLKTVNLKLWDERSRRLISFKEARAQIS